MGKRSASMLRGMAVLGIAVVISKLIGTLQKIPLHNIGGDAVYGIYNLIYPLYTLLIVIATAGFPLAVSKFVAERYAMGDERGAQQSLFISLIPLGFMGIIGFALLYLGAGRIAQFMGSPSAANAVRSISFALLILPCVAAFRGYFQGRQVMLPTAFSQIVEQLTRVATMVAILLYCVTKRAEASTLAAGAMFGSVIGGVAALIVMLLYWRQERRRLRLNPNAHCKSGVQLPIKEIAWRMTRYAIPVTMGMIVVPVLGIADSLTLPHVLQANHLTEMEALLQFGIYSRGIPFVQLMALLFSSMAASLVPVVTERLVNGQIESARRHATMVLQLAWWTGIAASFGLVAISPAVNVFLFKTADGTETMMILALAIMFCGFQIVSASILQGWAAFYWPALHLLVALIGKVLMNILWVPNGGLNGAAWATVAAYALAAVLNAMILRRRAGMTLKLGDFLLKPVIAATGMAIAVFFLMKGIHYGIVALAPSMPERGIAAIVTLLCIPAGIGIYYIAMIAVGFKSLSIQSLRSIFQKEGL